MTRATTTFAALAGSLLASVCLRDAQPPDYAAVFGGGAGEWVDLSHAFGPFTIHRPTDTAGFRLTELAYGHTEAGFFYASHSSPGTTPRPTWAPTSPGPRRARAALSRDRPRGRAVAGGQQGGGGGGDRHAQHRLRAVERLPVARYPVRAQRRGVRERGEPGPAAGDGRRDRGVADEDRGEERGAAQGRGVGASRESVRVGGDPAAGYRGTRPVSPNQPTNSVVTAA